MWEAAPAAYAAVICFATDVGSTNVLEFEHVSGELLFCLYFLGISLPATILR